MITKQQRKALLFIEAEMERTGVAPTIREIAAQFDYRSVSPARRLLLGLERRRLHPPVSRERSRH